MNPRRVFADLLYDNMTLDERIYCLTADLGYKMLDNIRDDLPNRFFNVGAAEQLMIGAGVGLALEGKIPICYSITPFALYRPFEWIRNYMNHEKIPVKIACSGLDKDYEHDGFTHWAEDAQQIMNCFPNIKLFELDEKSPADQMRLFLYNQEPSIIFLRR